MHEKTILITGANSGIGFETARALSASGNQIIMVTRTRSAGMTALKELQQATNSEKIHQYTCDLSSFRQVHELAEKLHRDFTHLDVLINNAGILTHERLLTEDGNEYQFQVNHLSPFLLTQLTIDLLRKAPAARIINLSSEAHKMGKIHFRDLNLENKYRPFKAYAQSKLANVLFTYGLCSRTFKEGITSNAVHPGVISSRFGQGRDGQKTPLSMRIFQRVAKSPVKGAETSVYLAMSPDMKGKSGGYYKNKKSVPSSRASYDPDAATALWEISLKMTGLEKSLI